MKTFDEFWAAVDVRGAHACWFWIRAMKSDGYGCLHWEGRTVAAHRLALSFAEPAPRPDACALHHCDQRPCCNPLHLYWGTKADNNADRARRGRNHAELRRGAGNGLRRHPEAVLRGSACGGSKLVEADVRHIRTSGLRAVDVTRAYGISSSQAKRIVRGETWLHVSPTHHEVPR